MPKIHLTSLLRVEERLLEAEYFARRLGGQSARGRFSYELNAFLAAARSVTFLLQKEMAKVPGFPDWWDEQRHLLAEDAAAAFFLKLRNYSQKEGRISVVGSASASGSKRRWSYRFAGNADPVPPALLHRDIADCCREHIAKLARIVLACTKAFPYRTCPRRALTPEGVEALQLSLHDIEEYLGFPRGWTEVGDPVSRDRQIYVLREHVDGLDFNALQRLARWKPKPVPIAATPSSALSERLLKSLVVQLEAPRRGVTAADLTVLQLRGKRSDQGSGGV